MSSIASGDALASPLAGRYGYAFRSASNPGVPAVSISSTSRLRLDQARRLAGEGRLDAAENAYRDLLRQDSLMPDALRGLADLALRLGRPDVALPLLERATIRADAVPDLWNALGGVRFQIGDHAGALTAFLRGIVLAPGRADLLYNAGVAARELSDLRMAAVLARCAGVSDRSHPYALTDAADAERRRGDRVLAVALLRQSLAYDPSRYAAWHNLGVARRTDGGLVAEATAYRRALYLIPQAEGSLLDLADCLARAGQWPNALVLIRRLLALNPAFAQAWYNYGVYLRALRQLDQEGRPYRRAISSVPTFQPAYYNIGCMFLEDDRLSEACRWFRGAAALNPGDERVWSNYGAALRALSLLPEAVAAFGKRHRLDPDDMHGMSNLLLGLAGIAPDAADEIARDWSGRFPPPPPPPRRRRSGRMRIGYLSPDLRVHSCAYFVEPLFAAHDRGAVEIFAYADVATPDQTTRRLQDMADHWRDIARLDDLAVEQMIRADDLDILVDLAGHTGGNRLTIFARKPAPIQVTWLGFNATTGLPQIDWKLVDPWIMPAPGAEWFAERLWPLDRVAHCWRPPAHAPDPADRIGDGAGIVFGSFNALHKLGGETLDLWGRVLNEVPGSRLCLKGLGGEDDAARARLFAGLARSGIDARRIEIRGWADTTRSHLAAYHGVDIGLDPFPYHGTTTTCEALWMGVPVVTLAGRRVLSRIGVSLLEAVGLGDLVATTHDAYVDIARRLAVDAGRRRDLRRTLRQRMTASALRDETGFARAVEAAFAGMIEHAATQA